MKFKIPVIGFIEKTIRADLVQKFLDIFRNTRDIHRVLVIIPLTWFISHSFYLKSRSLWANIFSSLSRDEAIWLGLCGFPALFVLCWAIFTSDFNMSLYMRQAIFAIWTGLLHRLGYGLEAIGTTYITTVSFLALTSYLPFAFWGLRPDQVFKKVKEGYDIKKNTTDAVIKIAPPSQSEAI